MNATSVSESVSNSMTMPYIDHCVDVDSHEMAPIHMWPEIFGDSTQEFVQLCSRMTADWGVNTIRRPDITSDDMEINDTTVWNARGPSAPGAFDLRRRIAVMDSMGVDRQLMFAGFGFIGTVLLSDPKAHVIFGFDAPLGDEKALARRAIQRHNEWCMQSTKELGARIRPVAILLTESIEQMMREAEELLAGGVRVVQIPNGTPPANMSPADAALDPFWNLFAKAGVPIVFHIGAEKTFLRSGRWDVNVPAFASALQLEFTLQPHWGATVHFATENYLAAMILGGVLERHPQLRIGTIEYGAQWIGPLAERLDMWAELFRARLSSVLSMKPSEYINRQVRAAPFHFEDVAMYFDRYSNLEDVYAFATDYPHIEGGKNVKQKFSDKLKNAGDRIRRKFFRDNGLFLLPD